MTSEPFTAPKSQQRARLFAVPGQFSLQTVWSLTAAIAAALAYYHWRWEGWLETIVFASAITTAITALLTLISRRILFSIAVVVAFAAMIVVASGVKRHYVEMVLHAYDVVFYLTSLSTLKVLWIDHRIHLLSIGLSFIATGMLAYTLYRCDVSRVPRMASATVLGISVAVGVWASHAKGERRNLLFYFDNQYLASFYASWSETLETLWRGQLLDALTTHQKPLFKTPATCATEQRPPHIILIHQESVVPPAFFADLNYDTSLDPFFRSFDGKLHRLRVETYGGASWLTEFSVLAGISTYSFGSMRTFVQSFMHGKVHDTLPQRLARCGYRNAVFYPVPKDFVSNGRFYAAAGMSEIFDFKAQGAKRYNERDKFYYGNALRHFSQHLAASRAPTFSYIITSATHLPYTRPYEPEINVPGGGPGTDPEMSEYLRRLAMAKMDYEAFRAELLSNFPNERFLIVQYGDHQPVATRTLLGFQSNLAAEDLKLEPGSPGFLTYYMIEGLNYQPPPMPEVDTLEVPYLGTVLLRAAQLPLSDAYQERQRLLQLCGGRYFTCPKRNEILGFHRRLIDSGLVEAR